MAISRRHAIAIAGTTLSSSLLCQNSFARSLFQDSGSEFDLIDDPTRGEWGLFDVDHSPTVRTREAKKNFEFPTDANEPSLYGIDISHHTEITPWSVLASAKVNYVYIKSSQGRSARDPKFVQHWQAAPTAKLPFGAYHFLSAGISGADQANWFLKRLAEVGGLAKGHLQPVVDLEWDVLGPEFKRTVIGHDKKGRPQYKDYWTDYKSQIVSTVHDFVETLVSALKPLNIRPLIYTNRMWWESFHELDKAKFEGCTVWISDYRQVSFDKKAPVSVKFHEYFLWQFTESATIAAGKTVYGPFDSNKLMHGGIENILIA